MLLGFMGNIKVDEGYMSNPTPSQDWIDEILLDYGGCCIENQSTFNAGFTKAEKLITHRMNLEIDKNTSEMLAIQRNLDRGERQEVIRQARIDELKKTMKEHIFSTDCQQHLKDRLLELSGESPFNHTVNEDGSLNLQYKSEGESKNG